MHQISPNSFFKSKMTHLQFTLVFPDSEKGTNVIVFINIKIFKLLFEIK